MTNSELIKTVAAEANISQVKAKEILATITNAIAADIKAGNEVAVTGFGKFKRVLSTGTVPGTQNTYSSYRMTFKQSSVIKAALNA